MIRDPRPNSFDCTSVGVCNLKPYLRLVDCQRGVAQLWSEPSRFGSQGDSKLRLASRGVDVSQRALRFTSRLVVLQAAAR